MRFFESVFNVSDSLNSIARDNGIKISSKPTTGTTSDSSTIQNQFREDEIMTPWTTESTPEDETQEKVNNIISHFEEKTIGIDIPFPRIEITEDQTLYSEEDLEEYVANQTIANLTNLGYITTKEDAEELKEVLLNDDKEMDYQLIDRINENAGKSFSYRYWGTFGQTNDALYAWSYEDDTVYTKTDEIKEFTRLYKSDYSPYTGTDFEVVEQDDNYIVAFRLQEDTYEPTTRNEDEDVISNALIELTSFNIKKSFKDRYRTIPCTKLIDATGNKRIFFVCPAREDGLVFYINSKRAELPSFPIDLGIVDALGTPIMYTVYYTTTGYNSNSVLFEVKKGGLI